MFVYLNETIKQKNCMSLVSRFLPLSLSLFVCLSRFYVSELWNENLHILHNKFEDVIEKKKKMNRAENTLIMYTTHKCRMSVFVRYIKLMYQTIGYKLLM